MLKDKLLAAIEVIKEDIQDDAVNAARSYPYLISLNESDMAEFKQSIPEYGEEAYLECKLFAEAIEDVMANDCADEILEYYNHVRGGKDEWSDDALKLAELTDFDILEE